ncbi:MAG: ATP-binding cassette domain-containing protein [Deferribacteraceae bacterium]|jgi:energy-coupling factor transporter ATP-binding protein EcfA2|nr:ATP-binding cassette domain-containing protein [Deferribacteraceae bacterium]
MQLTVRGASYKFRSNNVSLPDIDTSFTGLLVLKGRIGSGKTLLLKTIGGVFAPESGIVQLSELCSPKMIQGYFVHSQAEFNFITGLIGDELDFAGVSKAGFERFLNRNVNEMSGGELKALSVHMALLAAEDVVLLDEPLDMLDDAMAAEMAVFIAESAKTKPIIVATHDKHFDAYADKIIHMDFNELVEPIEPVKGEANQDILLETKALSVQLGQRSFPEVSLELTQGEIVCLYGCNGCGKTLFTRTIAGIGRWSYLGSYDWQLPRAERGVCLQFPEQMAYQETIADEIADNAGKENIDKVLDILGWQERGKHSPFSLSDGEKRTLYIISLLVKNKACIFDEPFAGLDQQSVNFIVEHFYKARARGISILYTANRIADSVYADRVLSLS